MAVRPFAPHHEEEDEDHLATEIISDRPVVRRPSVEAEGILLEDDEDDTPRTEIRHWTTDPHGTHEWEVTEQMPMPTETPPHMRRVVARPPAPPDVPTLNPPIGQAARTPEIDITPETPRRRDSLIGTMSEGNDNPPTLSNQPPLYEEADSSFAPLVALLAIPAMVVFLLAMAFIA